MLEVEDYLDANELGLNELNPFISVNISESETEGNVLAILEVTEPLSFHSELAGGFGDMTIFDAEGYLVDELEAPFFKFLEDRYDAEGAEYSSWDEPAIKFELVLDVPAETDLDTLGEMFWEKTKLVQFHNEADPGTFNCQYLFGSLVSEFSKDL